MKKERKNNGIFNLFSYIVLIVASILIFVNNLLPAVGITMGGVVFNILETLKDVLILIMIGIMSYNFILGKGKVAKIFYWVAIVIFVVGVVLRWI